MEQTSEQYPLTEKDIRCITRILQGCLFMDSLFWGCDRCCYAEDCKTQHRSHFIAVREKLTNLTGVYIGVLINIFEEKENVKWTPAPTIPHKAPQEDNPHQGI